MTKVTINIYVVGSEWLKPEWISHSESIMYGAVVAYI